MVNVSDDSRSTGQPLMRAPSRPGGDPIGPATLGHRLLELRLQHRQERLQLVLAALRDRARPTDGPGEAHVPEPLAAAIAGFEEELGTVRAELRAMGPAVPGVREDAP